MPITITLRDEKVLKLLGLFHVMTVKQVQEAAFEGRSEILAYKRLAKLRSAELVRSFPFGISGQSAWSLTAEGARSAGFDEKVFRRPPNRNTVQHDLIVADIGLKLLQRDLVHSWIGAHELCRNSFFQRYNLRIPDATFELVNTNNSRQLSALEIENTTKDNRRLKDFAGDYAGNSMVSDVFIFWRSRGLRDRLHKIAFERTKGATSSLAPTFWFSEKSLNEGLCFEFINLKGQKVNLLRPPYNAPRADAPSKSI